MIRLTLLSLAGFLVFLGFGMPFIMHDAMGWVAGVVVVLIGAGAVWLVELNTAGRLRPDSRWNRLMKADGEDLIERGGD